MMINPFARLRRKRDAQAHKAQRLHFARDRVELDRDLSFSQAVRCFPSRNDLFAYMHRYFFTRLPHPLREHRVYFSEKGRGFGEEAFHSMWYLVLREFRPSTLMEIGVFRGQVIS